VEESLDEHFGITCTEVNTTMAMNFSGATTSPVWVLITFCEHKTFHYHYFQNEHSNM